MKKLTNSVEDFLNSAEMVQRAVKEMETFHAIYSISSASICISTSAFAEIFEASDVIELKPIGDHDTKYAKAIRNGCEYVAVITPHELERLYPELVNNAEVDA